MTGGRVRDDGKEERFGRNDKYKPSQRPIVLSLSKVTVIYDGYVPRAVPQRSEDCLSMGCIRHKSPRALLAKRGLNPKVQSSQKTCSDKLLVVVGVGGFFVFFAGDAEAVGADGAKEGVKLF